MTIQHSAIQSDDCHEPKNISSALIADAGKVLTPSGSVDGASVLRLLKAIEVAYDNSDGSLTAEDVKSALDELSTSLADATGDSSNLGYDNSTSGLSATDVQSAIDEVDGNVDALEGRDELTSQADVADLNQTITDPPTQTEVQAISDKIDTLLAALRTANVLQV